MKLAFYLAAAVMIIVALVLLLLPLLRHGRRQGHSRRVFALALSIAFALPLAAAGLYFYIGTPAALNGVAAQDQQTAMNIDQAINKLRTHLADHPDDAQGWMLLAQTATALQQPNEARDAYARVLKLSPNDTAAMVGWAETDAMLRADHRIQGHARDLLERAVKMEPDNQRGLWLLGISQFQASEFADAASTWRLLQPQLEPGSKVAQAVAEQIALADKQASNSKPAQPESSAAAATKGPAITVNVSLAPALKNKLTAGDTLFVYARAEKGPPMPLAVARLDAGKLPTTVVLTDAMGMMPQMKLSSARQVFVGARISRSGQAIAASGDLEGNAGVVAVDSKKPINIVIDKVHG